MNKNKYIQRNIEKDILKWLDSRHILVIRGPRQAGKTTLLKQIKKEYNEKMQISNENIHWLNFDDEITKLDFEENPLIFIENIIGNKNNSIIFIDEIQYVKNAGKQMKLIFDTLELENKNIKFIVTGSSSLDLNKMGKYLVGRALYFNLYPFSFNEFLKTKDKHLLNYYSNNKIDLIDIFKNKKLIQKQHLNIIDKLNLLLQEYLTFGGYPEVVLEQNKENKLLIIKNIFNNYLEKDIVSLYGLKNKDKIIKLIKYLSNIQGGVIVYDDLSQFSGMHFNELKEVLQILEDTFIIKQIRPFHKNLNSELRKNPKIYFYDLGFRNMLINQTNFIDFGSHYEWFIFNLLKEEDLLFWRTKSGTEMDFIFRRNLDEIMPIEVKSELKIKKSFTSFLKEYKPNISIITNKNIQEIRTIEESKVFICPTCLLEKQKNF